jgi:hypothetical protein
LLEWLLYEGFAFADRTVIVTVILSNDVMLAAMLTVTPRPCEGMLKGILR